MNEWKIRMRTNSEFEGDGANERDRKAQLRHTDTQQRDTRLAKVEVTEKFVPKDTISC